VGRVLLQFVPLLVEYSSVPPVPLTVPMAMLPPETVQLLQLLLVMANAPVGAAGVVQVPGLVTPTCVELLRQPLAARTLANMVCAGPVWL
jgi:hypothetical protein